jgi:hypothetical protein
MATVAPRRTLPGTAGVSNPAIEGTGARVPRRRIAVMAATEPVTSAAGQRAAGGAGELPEAF